MLLFFKINKTTHPYRWSKTIVTPQPAWINLENMAGYPILESNVTREAELIMLRSDVILTCIADGSATTASIDALGTLRESRA